ncbi:alpha/beta hydrolase [Jatrophihabitans sp.]|uniref:alpha/beta fold hydrolase n=1 Tax=Jatrophihabitans sp. TaxID=1932789 RepID=UPI0030C76974|nr:hypothetical protein [Jatrophihabitans sp.]
MSSTRVCLIHGAATTSRIWSGVVAALPAEWDVACPDRPASGSLEVEIAALTPLCQGAVVVGISGGATLVLALATAGVAMKLAVAHEPAVGSLLPGLLAPMAAAYQRGGVDDFATTLYGPLWQPSMAPADTEAVARDLAMFRAFEPGTPAGVAPLITVGEFSPPIRREAADALAARFGMPVAVVPGVGHAAHVEAPTAFADFITAAVTERIPGLR